MTDAAASDREAIVAARRRLGRQVAHRTGYHRSAIAHAEAGDPASRNLIAAVDQVVGAVGRLVAAHDTITAAVAAARSDAARRARASAAALAVARPRLHRPPRNRW